MTVSHHLSENHAVKRMPGGRVHIYAILRDVAQRDRSLVGVMLTDAEMRALVSWWQEQEDEGLAFARELPEVRELIEAAKSLRVHYGTDWEFDSAVAEQVEKALTPFEEKT